MKYGFHPEALAEFQQAIDHYEGCEAGLGYDFTVEVHAAIGRAILYPKVWPLVEDGIRRSLTRRFPYGIMYSEEGGELFVLAVMHLRRRPDYWKHRQ